MTVIGDSAMTAANAMSLLSTEAQLASTGSNHRTGVARTRRLTGSGQHLRRSVHAGTQCVTVLRLDP
jgi:hypothetical protein